MLLNSEEDANRSRLSLHVINWALILVREGRERGLFENPGDATRVLDPLIAFKKSCSIVLKYQITAIPLSFVQVKKIVCNKTFFDPISLPTYRTYSVHLFNDYGSLQKNFIKCSFCLKLNPDYR